MKHHLDELISDPVIDRPIVRNPDDDAAVVALLRAHGAGDLLEMLGLPA